jgi:hypothetical protein
MSPTRARILAQRPAASIVIAAIWGTVLFLWFAGWRILDPANIGWLMNHGDPSQHYMGWGFFRHTPLLQFPLGANHAFGEDIGSSIVFSDSVPLMAFLFKPFSALLPTTFQYLGLWMMLCFVFQSVFAYRLVSRFIDGLLPCLLVTGLFVLSPVMMWRLLGHEALLAHWLILAALNVYFDSTGKTWKWVLLAVVAAAVHAYLTAMVLAIFLFDLIHQAYAGERFRALIARFAIVFVVLALWMWTIGYFYPNDVQVGGFGYFRFHLLDFFRPLDMWSSFLPLVPYNDYQAGGFNYLGLGGIGLLLAALVLAAVWRPALHIDWRVIGPLLALAVGLLVYAMPTQLPHFLAPLTSTFRVSGRFAWTIAYLVLLGAAVIVAHSVRKEFALVVFVLLFVVQCADLTYPRHVFVSYWSGVWRSTLVSPFWNDRAARYSRVEMVLPSDQPRNDLPVSVFAAEHGMTINSGYIARVSPAKLQKLRTQVAQQVSSGQYRRDTLYVFVDDPLFELAKKYAANGSFVGIVDGYRVVAP